MLSVLQIPQSVLDIVLLLGVPLTLLGACPSHCYQNKFLLLLQLKIDHGFSRRRRFGHTQLLQFIKLFKLQTQINFWDAFEQSSVIFTKQSITNRLRSWRFTPCTNTHHLSYETSLSDDFLSLKNKISTKNVFSFLWGEKNCIWDQF